MVQLEIPPELRDIALMNAVKVDDAHRILVSSLRPGDYYEPEVLGEDAVLFHKVQAPGHRPTYAQALAAIESSPLRFTSTWDELKKETR
jgi:hypothetical protein